MTAHVVYSALDAETPATLSADVIGSVIREDIGFAGLLMSDDLSMKALAGSLGERAAGAQEAEQLEERQVVAHEHEAGGVDEDADVDAVVVLEAQCLEQRSPRRHDAAQRLVEFRKFWKIGAQERLRREHCHSPAAPLKSSLHQVRFVGLACEAGLEQVLVAAPGGQRLGPRGGRHDIVGQAVALFHLLEPPVAAALRHPELVGAVADAVAPGVGRVGDRDPPAEGEAAGADLQDVAFKGQPSRPAPRGLRAAQVDEPVALADPDPAAMLPADPLQGDAAIAAQPGERRGVVDPGALDRRLPRSERHRDDAD